MDDVWSALIGGLLFMAFYMTFWIAAICAARKMVPHMTDEEFLDAINESFARTNWPLF